MRRFPATSPSEFFSARLYRALLAVLAASGLVSSCYLCLAHYRNFTDIGYQSFCAISRSLNCDTVAQSPYALFLNVPVAAWGILGYLSFLALMVLFKPKGSMFPGVALLCLLAGLFSLASMTLAFISILHIHSYCLVCLFIYGINFTLLLVTWMAQGRFGSSSFRATLRHDIAHLQKKKKQLSTIAITILALSVAGIFYYPRYWLLEPLPQNSIVGFGVTEDGSPWIGAQHPTLVIIEYADYLCFQCGKMHNHLRRLVNQYPDQIRLIHRHFPLDNRVNPVAKETVHPNAGLIALFALMAQEQNLFWPVNDALFREARAKQSINFSAIAKETGMDISRFKEKLNDSSLRKKLAEDIHSGIALKIIATPSYVVDGKLYSGTLPEHVFSPIFKEESMHGLKNQGMSR